MLSRINNSYPQNLDDVLANLTRDPTKNLELIAKYLSAKSDLCECLFVIEENEKFTAIASSGSELKLPDTLYAFYSARSQKCGVIIDNERKVPNEVNAAICFPIIITQTIEREMKKDRGRSDDYMSIKSYIYIQTKNPGQTLSPDILQECSAVSLLAGSCIKTHHIQKIASIDKLTGVLNRKYLDFTIEMYLDTAKKTNSQFALIMLDVDFFKSVNDTYGHLVGDEVLRSISKIAKTIADKDSIVGRYGGEEFVVLINNTTLEYAEQTAERLRLSIMEAKILSNKRDVTVSMGIAMYPEHAAAKRTLIEKADRALYEAKRKGRNRYKVWNDSFDETVMAKSKNHEFISDDSVIDAERMTVLFEILEIGKLNIGITQKLELALGKIMSATRSEACVLFLVENAKIRDSIRLSNSNQPDDAVFVNQKIVADVINKKNEVYTVDWDNNLHNKQGADDWQSVAAVPVINNGDVTGVLYLTVSIKEKEFTENETGFIHHLSNIISALL